VTRRRAARWGAAPGRGPDPEPVAAGRPGEFVRVGASDDRRGPKPGRAAATRPSRSSRFTSREGRWAGRTRLFGRRFFFAAEQASRAWKTVADRRGPLAQVGGRAVRGQVYCRRRGRPGPRVGRSSMVDAGGPSVLFGPPAWDRPHRGDLPALDPQERPRSRPRIVSRVARGLGTCELLKFKSSVSDP